MVPYNIVVNPNVLLVERETLCDSTVTDKDFDFPTVNGCKG